MSTMEERARADADDSDRFPPDRGNGERVGVTGITEGSAGTTERPPTNESPHLAGEYWRERQEARTEILKLMATKDAMITQLTKERDELRATIARMRTGRP